MSIRIRSVADEDACLQLLRDVHAQDGYPTRWPRDPRRFLAPPHEITAWVWTRDDLVDGHIALHANDHLPAVDAAVLDAGLDAERVGVVSRLFVAPTARRRGIGKYLLAHAAAKSHEAGLWPVLDVAKHYASANAFYESSGWTRAAALTLSFHDGLRLDSWLYVGPKLRT